MSFSMNFTLEPDLERKIMKEKIYGIWKEETAALYLDEYKREVQPLIGDKWAKLIDLSNWKSSYPEIINVIGQHLRWCLENGMVLSVNIINNPVTQNQLKRMFIEAGTEKISWIFSTLSEGDKFLKEHGF